jgi:hypothetical protein
MQLPVGRVLACRPGQQLQPFAGAVAAAQHRHICASTSSAAAVETSQAAAGTDNTAVPISQARERREFKARTSIKHILVRFDPERQQQQQWWWSV